MWDAIGNIGKLIGGFGSLYSGHQEQKMGKKLYELQKEQYNRSLKKEDAVQSNLDSAVNSVYGNSPINIERKKKDNTLTPQLNLGV